MIDTHSHIYLPEFDQDRDLVVERALLAGVDAVLLPNIDLDSVSALHELSNQYPNFCHPMMGLHPTSVKDDYEKALAEIKSHLIQRKYVAIGEVGIDLYWDQSFRLHQIDAFEQQLEWAKQYGLPVVIHCRDAFDDVLHCVEKHLDDRLSGVFHSFSGTTEHVARILEYSQFMFGINGIVTFKNSSIVSAVKCIPLDRLLVETDSPYLAPVPHRGRRNEPAYVADTVKHLATIYDIGFNEMAEITVLNAKKMFNFVPSK